MNPFGNIDEPEAPSWYLPDRPQWWRTFCWYLRNPLHNFTHYQIGWAHEDFVFETSVADDDNDGFADDGGWLHATLWRYDGATRPFVSYAGFVHFYIGWHPNSGKLAARISKGR